MGHAIVEGIEGCRVLVLIFSQHANTSTQVRREVERAIAGGKFVLPDRDEDVRPEGVMEYALAPIAWLDAFGAPTGPSLKELTLAVKRILGVDAVPAGSAPAGAVPRAESKDQGRSMEAQFRDVVDRLLVLPERFSNLREMIRKAILLADTDPEMALTRVRKVLESLVREAYKEGVAEPGTAPLEALIQGLVKAGLLPRHIVPYATFIRDLANNAMHNPGAAYQAADVHLVFVQLRTILVWYFEAVRPDAEAVARLTGPPPSPAAAPEPIRAVVERPVPPADRPAARDAISVFLSYRREDSLHQAGRLYDHLVGRFGRRQVFKDVHSIPPGLDFREILTERVAACDVFLAVIGDRWLSVSGRDGRRRIDDPRDFVRIEIEAALSRKIPVIPVLVGDSSVPPPEELPESLLDLAYRHASRVRPDPDFHHDMDRLIRGIETGISALRARRSPRDF